MSLADLLISLVIWVLQNVISPILPTNMIGFSFDSFKNVLEGTMKHNFIYGLAGLNRFFNLELLFILVGVVITGEIIFWGIKAGMFLWKSIRGGG